MNTERWRVLSEWHNTWLAAPDGSARRDCAPPSPPSTRTCFRWPTTSPPPVERSTGFSKRLPWSSPPGIWRRTSPRSLKARSVGPYRIVALLARGGMGDVYRATDPRLGRDVALKTLTSAERGDGHAVERFLQEARITASLDHPNIVKVFDVGMSNGRPYLVSELLDGETLRAPIGRGPLAPADARRIASALTSGLVAAHARGLVHRDLKPENIFLTRSGTAKILDFGIAKLAQDPALPRGLATLTGVVLGTAGYLAPEQVKGDPVDARTDLFALGSILFELMTGQRAFVRDHTIDTLHAIVHDDPPDLLPPGTAIDRHRQAPARQGAGCQVSVSRRPAVGPGADRLDRGAAAHAIAARRRRSQADSSRCGRGWAIAGAAGLAIVLMALLGGWLGERALSPSVEPSLTQFTWSLPAGTALDSAPIVSPTDGGSRSRPSAAIRRHACSCGRSTRAMPRHRRDRRSEAAVLVARRHVARVFCPRQTDESGGRGRRPGRTSAMRRTGRAARGVPRGRSCSAPT